MVKNLIEPQLVTLPAKPGVYLFKDEHGEVIYVGKATNLRNRVKSYFSPSNKLPVKIQQLTASIQDLELIVTESEQEALILECTLIKKYQPCHNVLLRDDKSFPYLKIDVNNDWPSVRVTRRPVKDGSKYFGPFARAGLVRKTLKLIAKIFPFRTCNKVITGTASKPCLKYHIHRCLGPCTGEVSREDYDEIIRQVIMFLEGKQELILRDLKSKMENASRRLQFEKAALLRDQIKAIESVIEGQKIAITLKGEQDAIALAQTNDLAYAEVFFIRNNKLVGRDSLLLDGVQDEDPEQIMTSFVKQYYASASSIPPNILLQYPLVEPDVIAGWLKNQRGSPVRIQVPRRGVKRQLLNMVAQNAFKSLELDQARQLALGEPDTVLQELKEKLGLSKVPLRIECYDISNIHGNSAVGSMVVFDKGIPKPNLNRRFKIKTVTGIDDYSMMQEVLKRRFHNYLAKEYKWSIAPDLVLIDGGKGHLSVALQVMKGLGLSSIPVASLAKENEDVFIPNRSEPVYFTQASAALYLLQRIRDEAHRFALSYHQKLRSKGNIASALDSVPGIGPKRKKALLKRFGSVKGIKEATQEELLTASGITNKIAEAIKEYL